MSPPVRDDRRDADADADLGPLLAELQDTLEDLRSELGGPRARPRPRPRPPTPRELLRFTEQYTIPTLIAVLEANVRLLELARGALRLADPGRDASAGSTAARDALSGAARDGADATLARLDDALSELRTALAETDLPDDPAARSLLSDARTLAGEVEDRLGEARGRADAGRRGRRSERTTIPVRDPDADPNDEREGGSDDRPTVDVDAELDSIREEVRGGERSASGDDAESDGAGSDGGDATDDGTDPDRDSDGTDDRPGN